MNLCPVCGYEAPPGWLLCTACDFELPPHLHTTWQCASHHAHARRANNYPPAEIARCEETERLARTAILSHLKQYGSAF